MIPKRCIRVHLKNIILNVIQLSSNLLSRLSAKHFHQQTKKYIPLGWQQLKCN